MQRLTLSHLLFLITLAGLGGQADGDLHAAELIRGPYLQTATPGSITIRWRTDTNTPSQVHYGEDPTNLLFTASDPELKTEHELTLKGLAAETRYYYSVGSPDEELGRGSDYRFMTPPEPGQARPTRIWVVGDSGSLSSGFSKVVEVRDAYYQYAGTRHTDVWLCLGDNAYDSGTDKEYQTNFFGVFADLLRQSAAWSTIGNHEAYSVSSNGVIPYLEIFSFPTNGEAGGMPSATENYYSFDHGNIHFVCLDSMMVSRATNGAMAQWLRADLAATTNDWIVAFWHHAAYSMGSHVSDTPYEIRMYEMRQNIVPILEEYGVDLVLAGHSHNYERSYLLHGHYGVSSTLQPAMILDPGNGREQDTGAYVKSQTGAQARKGAVYLTVGSSGSTEDLYGHHPAMFIARAQLGSLVLDVDGSRLDGAFLRETGAIDDRFTIIKGEPETLRLLPLVLRNGKVTVRWKAIVGRSYGIERHASWGTQSWEAVGGPITATGATCIWTNDQSGAGASFYRVVELPPASPARGGTVDDTHRPATDRVPANRPRLGAGEPPGVTDARPLGVPQAPVDAGTEPGELVAILAETASRLRGPAKDGGSPGATDELALQLRKVKAANRDGAAIQTPWLKQTRLRG